MASDWDAVLKAAKEQGWRVEKVKKGIRLVPPDPSKPKVVIHKTPSDRRALANKIRDLRASGFIWPWDRKKGKKR